MISTAVIVAGTALLLDRNSIRKHSGKDKQVCDSGRGTETILELEEYQSKSDYCLGS